MNCYLIFIQQHQNKRHCVTI